jgi:hypothetical protein
VNPNKLQKIAKACHEINRAYCQAIGDKSQVPWALCYKWQKEASIECVKHIINNPDINNPDMTPEQLHDAWMKDKIENGWVFGTEKNTIRKTHPCLLGYWELLPEQRVKDYLFITTVRLFMDD